MFSLPHLGLLIIDISRCDGLESGARCECICGTDQMTITFPLSYCGIKPLPEKFGFKSSQSAVIPAPEFSGMQKAMNDDVFFDIEPFFGNIHGNFQPSQVDSAPEELATGGTVSNPKVAVTSINNKDGVGAGKDEYKLYLGDGSTFPKKEKWVSFEDM